MVSESAVLTYHSLDDSGSAISVSPEKFREHMRSLADSGANVVPLPESLRTPGSIAITFDDGFQTFFDIALPVLTFYGFPVTVFVVTGKCGTFNDWNQYGYPVPRLPLMGWDQIREAAAAGTRFGAHTHTHAKLDASNAVGEMRRSRDELEQRLGSAASLFAYPYGHVDGPVRQSAQTLFSHACSTELAYVRAGCDPFCIPRVDAYYVRGKASELMTRRGRAYLGLRARLRAVRAWVKQGSV